MHTHEIQRVMKESQEGKLTFPEVVRSLVAIGVESYFVDFASGNETLYMGDGQTHVEAMGLQAQTIADAFSQDGLADAIRGSQKDTIRYPEFVKRSTAAGVIGYWAFLTGKKVVYFGRKGEMHVEKFPQPAQ